MRTHFIEINEGSTREARIRLEVLFDWAPPEPGDKVNPPLPGEATIRAVYLHYGFTRILDAEPLLQKLDKMEWVQDQVYEYMQEAS